jgi:hypothetical protein
MQIHFSNIRLISSFSTHIACTNLIVDPPTIPSAHRSRHDADDRSNRRDNYSLMRLQVMLLIP